MIDREWEKNLWSSFLYYNKLIFLLKILVIKV